MPICALILCTYDTGELAELHAVGGIGTEGAITAALELHVGLHAIGVHLSGHDIDHTCHGIAAVEQGGGTTQHFHFFCHHGLIGIGDGVPHESCILRLPVNEHEELGTAAHTAHFQAACSSCAHTIAQDASAGGEESGSLFHDGGQHGSAELLVEFLIADGGHREGEVAYVCRVSGTRDDHVL